MTSFSIQIDRYPSWTILTCLIWRNCLIYPISCFFVFLQINDYFLQETQPFYYWRYSKVPNYRSALLPAEENLVVEDDDSTISRWVCSWYELLSRDANFIGVEELDKDRDAKEAKVEELWLECWYPSTWTIFLLQLTVSTTIIYSVLLTLLSNFIISSLCLFSMRLIHIATKHFKC